MHDTGTDDMGDLVQSSESEALPDRREGPDRSPTEQARFVAGYFGWSITGDAIRGADEAVALYIEDLAAALTELGWISTAGIHWDRVPYGEHDAAEALRAVQRAHGWDI
ncbi:hypothetical protein ACR8AL_03235 [Clavibacter sepedonicus]|uniref:Uncharacterized protein n=1 Tax=Clavibacter sepedonicus TaxID=31964 RepID=B0RDI5_CLASE|nr:MULTISPECIES: hypothetical protein [Clavibacter]MBD5382512.1 hypothetical protein [Clavibacter sp.]OQJ48541.1 hypothetical protein B5P19_09960 [Clavibacter sepedonicus]OQJ54086.1 hypothetical protein B5P20_08145 [Clavibacter sepedonicus]UUK65621.1 hypothetical protein LRE50_15370 [Clavibacter sepedonicus]CAQ03114.1 hypothetical protein CMS3046 [Clavibacter sepedonicus]